METAMKRPEKAAAARYDEIDVARGFALFLVVFTHVLLTHGNTFNWIISFHMQAFFFLSGMTLKPERYQGFPQFLAHKFKKRIIPYFLISLIALAVCMLRTDYRTPILEAGWAYELKWFFYYGQPKNLYVGQIWFLVGLFMAEVIFYIWHRIFSGTSPLIRFYSVVIMALLALEVTRINALFPTMGRLPLKTDMAWAAAVFVIAGYYTQKHQILRKLEPYTWYLAPILIFFNYYFGPYTGGYTNICDCVWSPAAFFYSAAFCGTFAMCLVAVKLRNWRFWQYCGKQSLIIFATQTFAIYFVVENIRRFTGVWFDPMHNITSDKIALMITIAAFALILLFTVPFHWWKKRKKK